MVSDVLGKNSTSIKRLIIPADAAGELFEDSVHAAVGDVGVVKYYIRSSTRRSGSRLVPDVRFERPVFHCGGPKGALSCRAKINASLKKIVADGTTKNL